MTPDVSAVVCAFGPEPHLQAVVDALHASRGVGVEVLVVDNGSPAVAGLVGPVRVLSPGRNTGFAEGCNLGARAATGRTLVFVNSDALVDPDCVLRIHRALDDEEVGLAGATVLLADEPDTVNSWGNPVHLLGFSWAGGYGHPATEASDGPVASVSGAVFGARRAVFAELGGFDPAYFAYGEDVDLSLRCWISGRRVVVLSGARAWHHYDFSRNPRKMYLLERNRLTTVVTLYQGRTLVVLAPLLLAGETALLLRSVREGWLGQKVRGWGWLVRHRRYLRARRNRVQGTRRRPDEVLMDRLTADLAPPPRFGVAPSQRVRSAIGAYCDGVRSLVGARRRAASGAAPAGG
jgi:GT2 family glycosyltransferase